MRRLSSARRSKLVSRAFCAWNLADSNSSHTLSESALKCTSSVDSSKIIRASIGRSTGKRYFEVKMLAMEATMEWVKVGLTRRSSSVNVHVGGNATDIAYDGDGKKWLNGASSSYGAYYAINNSVVSVLVDFDSQIVTFWRNGVSQGAITTTGASLRESLIPAVTLYKINTSVLANFGATNFTFSMPSGYKAWDQD